MATNLQLYLSSAINFLQSCTIIFSPIATQMNNNLIAQGVAVNLTDPTTWRYYINLSGAYHSSDTVMSIISLDTKQTVTFTTAMLAASPKTAAAYVIGSSYYQALCQAYPTQVDLIKSIVYPVDINAAIAAKDFTLLGWGDGYLEPDEQDAVVQDLQTFIIYIATRWYFPFFASEKYYTWTFWSNLWQSLPNAIFATRMKYLHTNNVHSFHIWNYLASAGIGDYSDILDRQQSMFLYRNLEYLIANRGKQSNLVLLVNNLLDTVSVGLTGKTIYMNTATNAAACQWNPEFVSEIIPTDNSQSLTIIPPETMDELNTDLVNAGLEVQTSPAWVLEEQTFLSETTHNILPTKLVEIQQLGIDKKYGAILNNFIMDTLVSMIVTNRYTPVIDVVDPTTNTSISLTGPQALALYYYTTMRATQQQPILVPTYYTPSCAFQYGVTASTIPLTWQHNGYTYPTRSYISIPFILNGLTFPPSPLIEANDFATLVGDLFLVLVGYIRYSRLQDGTISLKMFNHMIDTYVLQKQPIQLALTPVADYATWLSQMQLTGLIATLDGQTDYTTAYTNLANAIITQLIPETSTVFQFFAYTSVNEENIYDRLKSLFIQLCSYNIAFLDTPRVNTWWTFLNPITLEMHAKDSVTISINPFVPVVALGSQDTMLWESQIADLYSGGIYASGDVVVQVAEQDTISINYLNDQVVVPLPSTLEFTPIQETSSVTFPMDQFTQFAFFTEDTSGVT